MGIERSQSGQLDTHASTYMYIQQHYYNKQIEYGWICVFSCLKWQMPIRLGLRHEIGLGSLLAKSEMSLCCDAWCLQMEKGLLYFCALVNGEIQFGKVSHHLRHNLTLSTRTHTNTHLCVFTCVWFDRRRMKVCITRQLLFRYEFLTTCVNRFAKHFAIAMNVHALYIDGAWNFGLTAKRWGQKGSILCFTLSRYSNRGLRI